MLFRFTLFLYLISLAWMGSPSKEVVNRSADFLTTISQDKEQQWLEEIFSCPNKKGFCFPDETKILTERFQRFINDSNELFMFSYDRSPAEQQKAEAAYRAKWKSTYPLYKEETWPFGRGNGGVKTLENVSIRSIGGQKYLVTIDFSPSFRSINRVTLSQIDKGFLIDYIKTEIIEFQINENQNRDLEFTQSWTWTYKDESIDKNEIGHQGKITAYYNPKTKNWLMNRDTYGFLGEMFKWVIGRPDGTYLYSTSSPHPGEGNDIEVRKGNQSNSNTEIPKYLKPTGRLDSFMIKGWPTGFLLGEEYEFVGASMAESNTKYLKKFDDMSFVPLYHLGRSFSGEPHLPYSFPEGLPDGYLLIKEKTIYAGNIGKAHLQLKKVKDTTITVKIEKP